jgi:hypothetical protein
MNIVSCIIAVTTNISRQVHLNQYSWINRIQAVAAGAVDFETRKLTYTLYEQY